MAVPKVIDDFTAFRAAVKGGTLLDPETIISTALRYDGDLVRIFLKRSFWLALRDYLHRRQSRYHLEWLL
jgi:hypothetical protein